MMEFYTMTSDHVAAVAALEPLCFADPWSERSIGSEVTNPLAHWIVAMLDGELVGYIGSQTVMGEADVMNLGVKPDLRSQGIGGKLLHKLEADLREKDVVSLTLEVRPSNAPAMKLYTRNGFVQVGCRKNYYHNPKEDGFILRKELIL